ncbi:MAG TPA: hypothetical protein PLW72_08725 [Burkholderiaceae bacterium]|nr:hypothetical protein [Burkholderiaceae bacterium]HQR75033.1 hypothetical protein [Burkholderiaceae bacterium]
MDNKKEEIAMFRKLTTSAAAFVAASVTTLSLLSAVAGLADADRALLMAAKQSPTLVAGNASSVTR